MYVNYDLELILLSRNTQTVFRPVLEVSAVLFLTYFHPDRPRCYQPSSFHVNRNCESCSVTWRFLSHDVFSSKISWQVQVFQNCNHAWVFKTKRFQDAALNLTLAIIRQWYCQTQNRNLELSCSVFYPKQNAKIFLYR